MSRKRDADHPASLFVDSSAWIAFFSAKDANHAACDRLMRLAFEEKTRLLTSNLVLAEVHRLLLFRAGITAAATALERIDASARLTILFADATTHREARMWMSELRDQVITYTDASSFSLMKANRCGVAFSFDHDFVLAGYSLWAR